MKIIGHRGARGLAPENTIAALQKGLEHGVDELEFDLRVTKDDVVILHHNAELHDTAGTKLSISEHSYAELKKHKSDLATFEEVLDDIGNKVPLLIEVKHAVPVAEIVRLIRERLDTGWRTTDFLLESKSQKVLVALHEQLPGIEKVVAEPWSGVRARLRAKEVGAKRLVMRSWWLWPGFLAGMYRAGYQIVPYTMNDPIKVKRWQKYLYGVITDYPDRFER